MHRPHAGHETSRLKRAVFQHIKRIFPVPDRRLTMRIDDQIFVAVEEPNLFDRHPHRLRRHMAKIFRFQALPARLRRQIEAGFIDQSAWLHPDPPSPVQPQARANQHRLPARICAPLAFMQRVALRIGRKKSSAIGSVEDQMAGGLANDASAGLVEVMRQGLIGRKPERIGRR